jgi:hypothetical protein
VVPLRAFRESHGEEARLFDNLGDPKPKLEQVEAIEAPGVTHIRYARV